MERIIADMFPDQGIEEVEAETVQKAEALSREYVRIFFAEDSKTIRETVVRALKKIGYKNIQAFENGKKAYEALRSISNQLKIGDPDQIEIPHILLTDIEMPQMDGLTPRHKTKKEMGLKQVLVIMFSGLINEQMILKCEDVGADGYVTKPYQYVGRYA